jgi:hypothetical protein
VIVLCRPRISPPTRTPRNFARRRLKRKRLPKAKATTPSALVATLLALLLIQAASLPTLVASLWTALPATLPTIATTLGICPVALQSRVLETSVPTLTLLPLAMALEVTAEIVLALAAVGPATRSVIVPMVVAAAMDVVVKPASTAARKDTRCPNGGGGDQACFNCGEEGHQVS